MSESLGPEVLSERFGHVVVIRINRPHVRNAINLAAAIAIGRALDEADADRNIRAVIVTGAGSKAFCAGADLKAIAAGESIAPDDPRLAAYGFAGLVRHPISKPLIAAVNGAALGGGTEITLACDLAIAASHASFGLPEVKRGIMAAAGGAFRLVQQLPSKLAMEMILTGESIDAHRALSLGLVNAVVPGGELLDRALDLAGRIAANAPMSVQASKRVAKRLQDRVCTLEVDAWAQSDREMEQLLTSQDAREGPAAFAEKRAPLWRSR